MDMNSLRLGIIEFSHISSLIVRSRSKSCSMCIGIQFSKWILLSSVRRNMLSAG